MLEIARLALFAWIPVCLAIFALCKPRRAVIISFIAGWMFLPMYAVKFKGIPDLTKITAASFGVMIGACLFDIKTLLKFRPKWYDLPMLVFCVSPFVTSIKNDLGWWDGASNVLTQIATWGLPYFIGRCYFNDWEGIRELGVAIVIGGLIYVPFCLFEIRFSPQLHKKIYGRVSSPFAMEMRWGGYRPQVFMQSGLAVSMWMITASLIGTWMWMSGALKKIWNVPMTVLLPVLGCTTILCKSTGALMLMMAGLGTLFWIKWLRRVPLLNVFPLLVLIAIPPTYMYLRGSMIFDGQWLIDKSYETFGEERGKSMEVRITAENLLTERAFEAPDPWFGWAKWDPATSGAPWRVYEERQKVNRDTMEEVLLRRDKAPTDGLWVITLGSFGLVGVISLTTMILLPAFIYLRRVPLAYWDNPVTAAASAITILLVLHMSDNLLNGMINPIFMLGLGGVSAIGPSIRKVLADQRRRGFAIPQYAQPAYASAGYPAAPGYIPLGYQVPSYLTGGAGAYNRPATGRR